MRTQKVKQVIERVIPNAHVEWKTIAMLKELRVFQTATDLIVDVFDGGGWHIEFDPDELDIAAGAMMKEPLVDALNEEVRPADLTKYEWFMWWPEFYKGARAGRCVVLSLRGRKGSS